MRRELEQKLAQLLFNQNRPIPLIELTKHLKASTQDLEQVINVLSYQGIISQIEFRNFVYIVLNCPGYGTEVFQTKKQEWLQQFKYNHFSELNQKMDAIMVQLQKECENE
ncbi:Conserved_hypothetical protein [Hexamita inflata]|uniref:Uncharacterized protein n=1 Tax=Hexamita inflata TaxID=28002 RepID=A0AA86PV88_9EUKA|nr:Conserved hypothetical protein [Hexamita inflata]